MNGTALQHYQEVRNKILPLTVTLRRLMYLTRKRFLLLICITNSTVVYNNINVIVAVTHTYLYILVPVRLLHWFNL